METERGIGLQFAIANENAWLSLGMIAEMMGKDDTSITCYEKALSHNRNNMKNLFNLGCCYEKKEQYTKGSECFKAIVSTNIINGDAWNHLGFCLVQLNELSSAYTAYQHALYHMKNPARDPSLWYGVGLLYEKYGALDYAEETFQAIFTMEPSFEIAWESKFRLGVIAKYKGHYDESLDRLRTLLEQTKNREDIANIWSEIGSTYEMKNEIQQAKAAYQKVVEYMPHNSRALQQLGWLCLKSKTEITSAIEYLKQAVATDSKDPKGWYLLGRCYMSINECEEGYYAYKEALALDANNPNIWCSLGVLFYQLGQYLDALDAYSRAINANPNICEVWYNVGTLYDTCNQTSDARDAYQKAAELGADPNFIRERLEILHLKESGKIGASSSTSKSVSTPVPSEPPTSAPIPPVRISQNSYPGGLPGQLTATPATSNNNMNIVNNNNLNKLLPPNHNINLVSKSTNPVMRSNFISNVNLNNSNVHSSSISRSSHSMKNNSTNHMQLNVIGTNSVMSRMMANGGINNNNSNIMNRNIIMNNNAASSSGGIRSNLSNNIVPMSSSIINNNNLISRNIIGNANRMREEQLNRNHRARMINMAGRTNLNSDERQSSVNMTNITRIDEKQRNHIDT